MRQAISGTDDPVAPEIIDAEVVGVLRKDVERGELDASRAEIAILELFDWPGERIALRNVNQRVWDPRASGPTCTFITP